MPLEELNLLEKYFLDTIDYRLTVTEDQLSGIDKVISDMFSSGQSTQASSVMNSPHSSQATSPASLLPAREPVAVSNNS